MLFGMPLPIYLLLAAPIVWFWRGRSLYAHLSLILCQATITSTVFTWSWIPPAADHGLYTTLGRNYLAFPLGFVDAIIAISDGSVRLKTKCRDLGVTLIAPSIVFVSCYFLTPIWLRQIGDVIATAAKQQAAGHRFCMVVDARPVGSASDIQMPKILKAFGDVEFFSDYYVKLKIDGDDTQRNWSFRSMRFVVSSDFEQKNAVIRCKPE